MPSTQLVSLISIVWQLVSTSQGPVGLKIVHILCTLYVQMVVGLG